MWHLKNEKNASRFDWTHGFLSPKSSGPCCPTESRISRARNAGRGEGAEPAGWRSLGPLAAPMGTFLSRLHSRGEERGHICSFSLVALGPTQEPFQTCSLIKLTVQGIRSRKCHRSLIWAHLEEKGGAETCQFSVRLEFNCIYKIFSSFWGKRVTLPTKDSNVSCVEGGRNVCFYVFWNFYNKICRI